MCFFSDHEEEKNKQPKHPLMAPGNKQTEDISREQAGSA